MLPVFLAFSKIHLCYIAGYINFHTLLSVIKFSQYYFNFNTSVNFIILLNKFRSVKHCNFIYSIRFLFSHVFTINSIFTHIHIIQMNVSEARAIMMIIANTFFYVCRSPSFAATQHALCALHSHLTLSSVEMEL